MSPLQSFLFEVRNPSLLRAFIAAVAAPPLAMMIYGIIASVILGNMGREPDWLGKALNMATAMALFGSVWAYVGVVLVGLPTFVALMAMDAQRGVAYLVVGTIPLPLLLLIRSGELPGNVGLVILAATPGLLVAGCWWLLASR